MTDATNAIRVTSTPEAPRPLDVALRAASISMPESVSGRSLGTLPLARVQTLIDAGSGMIPRDAWSNHGIRFSGRSLILSLTKEDQFVRSGRVLSALKMKGVTNHGESPSLATYLGHPRSSFSNSTHTFSVENGRIQRKPAPSQPMGHMSLDDAENEFTMARLLLRARIPPPYPIAIGTFSNLRFEGKEIGTTILGITDPDDRRLSDLQPSSEFVDGLKKAAALLRECHRIGICHYNPHDGNFTIDTNGRVGICDLEDSRHISPDNEFDDVSMVYRARDLVAFLKNMVVTYSNFRRQGDGQGLPTTLNGLFKETLISGYFSGLSSDDHKELGLALREDAFLPILRTVWESPRSEGQEVAGFLRGLSANFFFRAIRIEAESGC